MENAVTKFGHDYQFTAGYYGSAIGYVIKSLNGVEFDDHTLGCNWQFFTRRIDGKTIPSYVGITNFIVNEDGLTILLRYRRLTMIPNPFIPH